ncbi:MAG: Coenzyme F420 hydrogenase/dehydrogenase, beta subunit C-terminal domain [Flexilinea sp.]
MIEITEKYNCSGCKSCYNVCPVDCISMDCDQEGFWYPSVDKLRCVRCEKCVKACPILNPTECHNDVAEAYAARAKDDNIRLQSSSGGIFTLLAETIIDKGGIVFGAVFAEDFSVHHIIIRKQQDISKLRGSKYVQSDIGESFKETQVCLENNLPVLFSGTPCQIAGLISFLNRDYEQLLCVDFICHGVPSPKVWRKYINLRESISNSVIQSVAFRNKRFGWKKYSVFIKFSNGTEYLRSLNEDIFMKSFLKNLCLRPSCFQCRFKKNDRLSDITLADFWGISNLLDNFDDDNGVSLVWIHSQRGKEIFSKNVDRIDFRGVDLMDTLKLNPSATRSVTLPNKREFFFTKLDITPIDRLIFETTKESLWLRMKEFLFKNRF